MTRADHNPDLRFGVLRWPPVSPESETVLHDALALPSEARAEVAAELLASLEGPSGDDAAAVEAAWAKEIERRALRALSGEDRGEPWEAVAARVRSNLRS